MIPRPDVGLPLPRIEASLALKLAKEKPKSMRPKKSLDGLYEVLAPGSSVIKSNKHTSVIKEPGRREVIDGLKMLCRMKTKSAYRENN